METPLSELVRRINKVHDHLSRERDPDLRQVYLNALVEAGQELSARVSHRGFQICVLNMRTLSV